MTKKWFGWRLGLGSAGFVVAAAAVLLGAPSASAVSGAINTTDDPLTNPCLHGPTPSVNCNLYGAKGDVWLSGSPIEASLGDGTYIFAVLDPGGQKNPNDGISGNLSSPDGPAAQREFSISAGTITNLGTH